MTAADEATLPPSLYINDGRELYWNFGEVGNFIEMSDIPEILVTLEIIPTEYRQTYRTDVNGIDYVIDGGRSVGVGEHPI